MIVSGLVMSSEKSIELQVETGISPGAGDIIQVLGEKQLGPGSRVPQSCPDGIPCVVGLWRRPLHVESNAGQATFL